VSKIFGAYIFLADGFSAETHSSVQESSAFKIHLIGIAPERVDDALTIAKRLADEGVTFIELCGGFGPIWISKIKDATAHRVPVGGVFYGPEDRRCLKAS